MRVTLTRPFIVQLYCYLLQSERSVACGLGAEWTELRAYFQGDRIRGLEKTLEGLSQLAIPHPVQNMATAREEVANLARESNFLNYIESWFVHWRQNWSFAPEFISFTEITLRDWIEILMCSLKPNLEHLIQIRMDLCFCRSLIESRCQGLREIQRAKRLEHFWQAPWILPVRFKELVHDATPSTHPARHSA